MTVAAWLAVIQGVLQFPQTILALIKILQTTPEAQHQQVLAAAQAEANTIASTGRPTWGG